MLIRSLDASLERAWADLFRRAECPCFCRYWHFEGDKNAWLDRCANDPERSLKEQIAIAGTDAGHALVAVDGERVIGHMKLAPRAALPKLRKLSVYRSHDLGADEGVWSIGCVLVDPERRGQGVPRALILGAVDFVRAKRGRAIEAYPRAGDELRSGEAWMGREQTYRELGFVEIGGERPYPVLRLTP